MLECGARTTRVMMGRTYVTASPSLSRLARRFRSTNRYGSSCWFVRGHPLERQATSSLGTSRRRQRARSTRPPRAQALGLPWWRGRSTLAPDLRECCVERLRQELRVPLDRLAEATVVVESL